MSFRRNVLRSLEKKGKVYRESLITSQSKLAKKFLIKHPNANMTLVRVVGCPYNLQFKLTLWKASQ